MYQVFALSMVNGEIIDMGTKKDTIREALDYINYQRNIDKTIYIEGMYFYFWKRV